MIKTTKSKIHWNYFIALEHDLEIISRYIEFNKHNFNVYSTELAHLLFAAASEVDVVAKLLCKRLKPEEKARNMDQYRPILLEKLSDLPKDKVVVPRYGLTLKPFDSWIELENGNPLWWKNYNDVKHERNAHFDKATLKNALNALSALLILVYHHYSYELCSGKGKLSPKETTKQLEPKSTLLLLPDNYYYGKLLF